MWYNILKGTYWLAEMNVKTTQKFPLIPTTKRMSNIFLKINNKEASCIMQYDTQNEKLAFFLFFFVSGFFLSYQCTVLILSF